MASPSETESKMTYRFLGNTGLLVSKLSLGSWMDASERNTPDAWYDMMALAYKHGINFFDNAECYGGGLAEKNMGAAVKKGIANGTWTREDLVLTTKMFFGSKLFGSAAGPNEQGLTRKHIVEGMKGSLARMGLDYVDVVFCHRSDPFTPIEETVRAMNFVIDQGWAFYWGTSEWSVAEIQEACEIADRLGLIRPVVEQPEYNLVDRSRVEFEYRDLVKKYKLGLTTWSPLAFGALTGKYSSGAPEGTRGADPLFQVLAPDFAERVRKADTLKPIADELQVTLAEFAIAWCMTNEDVSTVMIGAKNIAQLQQNLGALKAAAKITPQVKARVDALVPAEFQLPQPDPSIKMREQHL